jgi:hypothetical protein
MINRPDCACATGASIEQNRMAKQVAAKAPPRAGQICSFIKPEFFADSATTIGPWSYLGLGRKGPRGHSLIGEPAGRRTRFLASGALGGHPDASEKARLGFSKRSRAGWSSFGATHCPPHHRGSPRSAINFQRLPSVLLKKDMGVTQNSGVFVCSARGYVHGDLCWLVAWIVLRTEHPYDVTPG